MCAMEYVPKIKNGRAFVQVILLRKSSTDVDEEFYHKIVFSYFNKFFRAWEIFQDKKTDMYLKII